MTLLTKYFDHMGCFEPSRVNVFGDNSTSVSRQKEGSDIFLKKSIFLSTGIFEDEEFDGDNGNCRKSTEKGQTNITI